MSDSLRASQGISSIARKVGVLPGGLACLQLALAVVTTSPQSVRDQIYGCAALCASSLRPAVFVIVTILSIAMFVIPSVIGFLSNTWQGALCLSCAPWWLITVIRAGHMLSPYVGLGPEAGRFDDPFWLNPAQVVGVILPFLVFAVLTMFGWIVRQAFIREPTT